MSNMNTLNIFIKSLYLSVVILIIESFINLILIYIYIIIEYDSLSYSFQFTDALYRAIFYSFYRYIYFNGILVFIVLLVLLTKYNNIFNNLRLTLLFTILNYICFIITVIIAILNDYSLTEGTLRYYPHYEHPDMVYFFMVSSALSGILTYITNKIYIWLVSKICG